MGKTQVDASFQPGSHFTGHVRTKVETLVTGFECNTLIVQVAGRKEVLYDLDINYRKEPYSHEETPEKKAS